MDRDAALAKLGYPAQWCQGARALARLGDPAALVPLMQAYETPVEVSKVCLLDAMDALGAETRAQALYDSDSAEQRRLAVHLMELFPAEAHLPILERAVMDGSAAVREQARRSLRLQLQTPAWEAVMVRLLDAEDAAARAQAIESLSRRKSEPARQALRTRLASETDGMLRIKLEEALGTPDKRSGTR
jgi:HEAT repeat protein